MLNHPPRNWDAIKFNLTRDQRLKGLTRKFSTTLEFCDDGFEIIRDLFFTQGIDAFLQIEINQLVSKNWKEVTYREVFYADFSESDIDELKASIKMSTSDFERKLLDRQSDKFNLNTLESVDGIAFTGEADNYETLLLHDRTLLLKNRHEFATTYNILAGWHTPVPIPFDMNIIYSSNPNVNNVSGLIAAAPYDLDLGQEYSAEFIYLLDSDKDISMHLVFDINIDIYNIQSSGTFYLSVSELDKDHVLIQSSEIKTLLHTSSAPEEDTWVNVTYADSIDIDIAKGNSLIIAFSTGASGSYTVRTPLDGTKSYLYSENVDYIEVQPTECKVILPFEAFERTLQIITGVQAPLYSPVFGRTDLGYPSDGDLALMPITNGLFVRQFPLTWTQEDGTVKTNQINTSFKDLFDGYNAIMPLAAYIQKFEGKTRLVIDKFENIFNASKVGIVLDVISDLSFTPNTDSYYSTIKCGYENQEHEEINGLEAFCGEVNYSLPVGNTTNAYEIVSKFVGDDIAWSLAQRKPFSDYPTEDTRWDEKIMVMDCKWQGGYLIPRRSDEYTSVTGVFAPDLIYNLNISPKRNLLNHKKIISSGLLFKQDKSMKFTKGSKNENLATQKIGESSILYENVDIDISDLGLPIYAPFVIKLKTTMTNEVYDYIVSHSSEVIEFIYKKRRIYGFIDDLSYDRYTESADLKLLQSNR